MQGWKDSELLPPLNKEVPAESRRYSFLLDFVIWRRDIEGKEGAWIACESEWDINEKSVIKDFEKLLSFRAPYKLMIYDVKASRELKESCHTQFKKTLSAFRWHIDDEIYIFIEFIKGEGIANCYTCKPGEDLKLIEP